ncbi:preprotein translocase subunit YajC [Agromyces sp. SYSU T00194]|uniref:preprotein translocase subunit YajC n=1 Tax=Agromyces chitinivorans TaxID=3158560 RepID=UPI003394375C
MDPFTLIMLAVLALLIFFMFRNSRKRAAEQRELQSKVATGAQVMTNFGVFGTILSIDEEENQVLLESSPGTVLTVHRQTINRVVTPAPGSEHDDDAELEGEPEYGERVDDADQAPDSGTEPKKSDD